jgi:probable F420-dependent oxidoreductase
MERHRDEQTSTEPIAGTRSTGCILGAGQGIVAQQSAAFSPARHEAQSGRLRSDRLNIVGPATPSVCRAQRDAESLRTRACEIGRLYAILVAFHPIIKEFDMSAARPFRFGVQTFSADSPGEWRDRAKQVEDLGYSALTLADHFIGPGPALESTNHPLQTLAAVPAMAVAAEATERIRIGCRVFCQDYRHPVILAKEAATHDLLSEGRLEFGIGAGWLEAEYKAAGMAFDTPGVRISRLAETIALMKMIWSGEPVVFKGEYWNAEGFTGSPLPTQRPGPSMMIGGGGKRVLSLAAREADIVSFNFNNRSGVLGAEGVQSGTPEATKQKIEWVRAAAGDRFDALTLEIGAYFTFVGPGTARVAEGMATSFGIGPDEMRSHPHALFGEEDEVCEELLRRRERYGISYITVSAQARDTFAPIVARLAGR